MDYSKTAKEMMEEGTWNYLGSGQFGKEKVHYYAGEDYKKVYWMACASKKGYIVFWLLKQGCKILRGLFNIISKGLGDKIFSELIEECTDLLLASKHRLSVGNAVTLRGEYGSREDCIAAVSKEVLKLKEKVKRKKVKRG